MASGAAVGVLVDWVFARARHLADTTRSTLTGPRSNLWLLAGVACQLFLLLVLFYLDAFPRMDLEMAASVPSILFVAGFLSYALAFWQAHRLHIAAWTVAASSMAALVLFSCLGLYLRLGLTYMYWFVTISIMLMLASVFCGAFLYGWVKLSRHLTGRLWLQFAGGLLTAGIAAAFTCAVLYVYMISLIIACLRH
jgi:hypothetical protein